MPDTYTSQFSGEEIDSALRAAQMISGASTPAELRKKLEIRGDTIPVSVADPTPVSEALTASGGSVNPNLLDNWYFGRPVNQRGQTEYTGGGYCIDRWMRSFDGKSTLSLSEGGIKITSGATSWNNFEQKLENFPANTTVTISFLVDDTANINQVYVMKSSQQVSTFTPANKNLFTFTTNVGDNPSNNGVGIQVKTDKTAIIYAAKLELGSAQTLAHKENGVWVLNEVPDFGEQLRRCQRYYYQSFEGSNPKTNRGACAFIAGTASSAPMALAFPVEMRTTPVVKIYSPQTGNEGKAAEWITDEDITAACHTDFTNNKVLAINTYGNATIGKTYAFHYTASADL
nr:MAG TPA: hypothetical protein [Caudoviricetes sp.]